MLQSARNTVLLGSLAFLAVAACGGDEGDERGTMTSAGPGIGSIGTNPSAGEASLGGSETGATDGGATSGATEAAEASAPGGETTDSPDGPKFDLGGVPDGGAGETGAIDCMADPMNPACMCTIPDHVACDDGTQDPFNAMGLNCPGELQVMATKTGDGGAIGVRSNFGQAGIFIPREGSQYAVIGSGLVAELNNATPGGDDDSFPTFCNDTLGGSPDPGQSLPAPLKVNDVAGDCTANAGLLGTGDCSNTIQGQFTQGGAAYDYTELRFVLQVPPDVVSFSYDFAFFSTEYPVYFGTGFNDMYVGWLDSEKWTGNISFDAQGNPISLNAGFLEFKDDNGNNPVLAGTCMRQHAGTNWLQTTAGVTPGETITVVFAIFDLGDPILDSYAFLDNFKWGCEPQGKPMTNPPG